jgi:ATP-binding cassette subfamily C exporter for protease/lipase
LPGALALLFLVGFVVNLLQLTGSLYMMQVYDRVLNSRNLDTLVMLTVLIVGLYAWMASLEAVRHAWTRRAAAQAQALLAPRVFDAAFQSRLAPGPNTPAAPFADLATLRSFVVSPGFLAVLDAPFAAVVMLILFVMHPWLGLASVLVALLLALQGWVTDRGTRVPLQEAGRLAQTAQQFAGRLLSQVPSIQAMGMRQVLYAQWERRNQAFLDAQMRASDSAGQGSAAGGAVAGTGGAGGATGAGGAVTLTSGAGGATSGASGAANPEGIRVRRREVRGCYYCLRSETGRVLRREAEI